MKKALFNNLVRAPKQAINPSNTFQKKQSKNCGWTLITYLPYPWGGSGADDSSACTKYFGHISVISKRIRVVSKVHVKSTQLEKKIGKILKIGLVIAIFDCLTKIQKQVKKFQKSAFFDHIWIDNKFSNQAKILRVFKNGVFRFHLLYQQIDIPNFF